MNNETYRAFLDLLMCSDPYPDERMRNHALILVYADEQAEIRGFDTWIDAYHSMPRKLSEEEKVTLSNNMQYPPEISGFEGTRDKLNGLTIKGEEK